MPVRWRIDNGEGASDGDYTYYPTPGDRNLEVGQQIGSCCFIASCIRELTRGFYAFAFEIRDKRLLAHKKDDRERVGSRNDYLGERHSDA